MNVSRPRAMLLGCVVVVATLVPYAQVFGFSFLSWDDNVYVTDNPMVRAGLTGPGVRWAFGAHAGNWHPLTWLTLMLDARTGGVRPAIFHAMNLAWHAAAALLLFILLVRSTRALGRSAFVALLFAVHPLHVESVAWISERKDVLCGFFWVLTMLAYVRYAEAPGLRRYVWVVVSFALCLMSKSMGVTLPIVLLLWDVWPLQRVKLPVPASDGPVLRRLILEKIPLLVLSAGASIAAVIAQRSAGAMAGTPGSSAGERVVNALTSYATYLGQMLWPVRLSFFYPHPRGAETSIEVLVAVAVLVALSLAALLLARRREYVAIGWLWYLITLIPVIGLVQVGGQARADRYTYIPLIGVFIAIVWGVHELLRRSSGRAREGRAAPSVPVRAGAIAGGLVIAVLALVARAQASYWKDDSRLYSRAVALNSENALAHTKLATAMLVSGDVDGAVQHARESIRLTPDEWRLTSQQLEAPITLATALTRQRKFDEAVAIYRAAIAKNPRNAMLRSNLGACLGEMGRLDDALVELREAVRLDPGYGKAHRNLGIVLAQRGQFAEAVPEFAEALRADPGDAEVRSYLERARALSRPQR